ncbi:piggyBac transposable element-derived protein 3-like [Bactrocera neohumeralis]|uniref:piggyBac transposable element-derived protein 3-like n=1 Tax=Bactrocera neohumeralis TaxID=98809 RepID=UPI002165EC4D|nr:piggyBac transposable element-derived protein 3-like [Bactrocera neohumeralis]
MLDYLESLQSDDEDIDKVYLEPPDEGQVSDEDSGEEDCGGTIENLSKKQLQAPYELVCTTNDDDIPVDDALNNTDDDIANLIEDVLQNSFQNIGTNLLTESPSSSIQRPPEILEEESTMRTSNKTPDKISVCSRSRKRHNTSKRNGPQAKIQKVRAPQLTWVESIAGKSKPFFPEPNYKDCSGLFPHQQFEKFIDDEVLQMLCDESNAYSVQVEGQNPNITINEMKVFIGIMIVTGYTSRPKKRDYWCEDSDMLCSMISESMRRNRFEIIFRYMHFKDNSLEDRGDKIWKIHPITDAVKR